MANDVKWTDWRSVESDPRLSVAAAPSPGSAQLQLLGCLLGLAALTAVLPGPASWGDLLTGSHTGSTGLSSIDATAETAVLITAGVLVWALLGWVLIVLVSALAARLPGVPGRCGRTLLGKIAPAAAGRILAAAVGVSVLAGTSACAVPGLADVGSVSTAAAAIASTPAPLGGGAGVVDSATSSATPTQTGTTDAGSPDDVIATITIDWPAATDPATPQNAADPGSTTVADNGDTATPTPPAADGGSGEASAATTGLDAATTTATTADHAPEGSDGRSTSTAESGTASTSQVDAGAAVTGSETATAQRPSVDAPVPSGSVPPAAPTASGDGGPRTTPSATNPAPGASAVDGNSAAVVVLAGDTLWSIALHHLTPAATDQEIDTAWRAWYSANAQVIGANPDLIQPGQLLLPPDPEMGP